MERNILHKAVSLRASLLLLLQLAELELTKRLEDILEVLFRNREVDVADVEAVERDAVREGGDAFGVTGLAVLFCFGELGDDRNAEEFLSSELQGLLNGRLFLELDVADTAMMLVHVYC